MLLSSNKIREVQAQGIKKDPDLHEGGVAVIRVGGYMQILRRQLYNGANKAATTSHLH